MKKHGLLETVRRSMLKADDFVMEIQGGKEPKVRLMKISAILNSSADILLRIKHELV